MIDILAIILGCILTFVIVVVVHELGHLFAARLVGVRAEIFSVGFGRPIWQRRDRSGLLWQVTAIPAGGYVRFLGDENAASMTTAPDAPAQPGSLRSVSKRAQAFVAVAGPAANLIFTALLLMAVSWMGGQTAHPWKVAQAADLSSVSELQTGDLILSVDGRAIDLSVDSPAALSGLPASSALTYQIERNGSQASILAPRPDLPLIGLVADGSPAARAGIHSGDLIAAIDSRGVFSWSDLQAAVAASNGEALAFDLRRDGETVTTSLAPELRDGRWLIGVGPAPLFTLETSRPSILAAVGDGFARTGDLTANTVRGLSAALLGRSDSCDLDGPIGIATVAGQALQLGPETFLLFLAIISLGLGLLNLLPVPILDGGHLMLLGYEGLAGRPLHRRLQAVFLIAGVTAIVFLMITATINDLTC